MATTLSKTILITTLPKMASPNANFIQTESGVFTPKIGIKRPFSIISSSPSLTTNVLISGSIQGELKHEMDDDDDDDEYEYSENGECHGYYLGNGQPARKRERLTHLSPQEKLFRRKMKNRIAAQTARDRKKAMMVNLEETVRRLEEDNDMLLDENSKLHVETSALAAENERLKRQLAEQEKQQELESTVAQERVDVREVLAFGPAEFISVPLPKEQAKTEWALTWLVASALIQLYSKYCAKLSPEEEQKLQSKLEELKENDSLTLDEILSQFPSEAVQKLRAIIRASKMTPSKPP